MQKKEIIQLFFYNGIINEEIKVLHWKNCVHVKCTKYRNFSRDFFI